MYNFERSRTNKGYVSSVRVCVYIYEALLSMTITRINRKCSEFLVRNGSKRPHERNLREMQTRGHKRPRGLFFILHKLLKKENFKP